MTTLHQCVINGAVYDFEVALINVVSLTMFQMTM